MCQKRIYLHLNIDMNMYLYLNVFVHDIFTYHIYSVVKRIKSIYEEFRD
jgi:hypothetical protein